MSMSETEDQLTRQELARELAEVFDELSVEQINEVLAKNVPYETLEFFANHGEDFGRKHSVDDKTRGLLPNLMLLGYLLRVLEERLLGEGETRDA